MTGKARGLGFVEFGTREEAQAALDDAASLEVDGRLIQVTFSDNKPERTGAAPGGYNKPYGGQQSGGYGGQQSGGYGGQQSGGYGQQSQRSNYDGERHAAFVGNLGFRTNEGSVRSFFGDCGNVVDVRIAKSEDGKSRGFCHVDFDSSDALQKAIAKAGQDLDGRPIRVDQSTPRAGGGSGGRGGDRGGRGGRGGFGGGRGGRGGFGNPMDRAKKTGGLSVATANAVQTFDDDE